MALKKLLALTWIVLLLGNLGQGVLAASVGAAMGHCNEFICMCPKFCTRDHGAGHHRGPASQHAASHQPAAHHAATPAAAHGHAGDDEAGALCVSRHHCQLSSSLEPVRAPRVDGDLARVPGVAVSVAAVPVGRESGSGRVLVSLPPPSPPPRG